MYSKVGQRSAGGPANGARAWQDRETGVIPSAGLPGILAVHIYGKRARIKRKGFDDWRRQTPGCKQGGAFEQGAQLSCSFVAGLILFRRGRLKLAEN